MKPMINTEVMWPCVSCGFGEPMRDAYIAIDSTLTWDANWRLQSHTKARPAEFPNGCPVTVYSVSLAVANWKKCWAIISCSFFVGFKVIKRLARA